MHVRTGFQSPVPAHPGSGKADVAAANSTGARGMRRWDTIGQWNPVRLLLLAGAGCSGGDAASSAIRSDSAGIEIVVSAGLDRPLTIEREPVFVLGGEDEGPESFYRVSAFTVGADAAGNIHVLWAADNVVEVFDAGGRHVRTLGGAGGGPGEIQRASSLAVSADGTVAVFDFGKRVLVRFGPAGDTLPELPFPHVPFPSGQRFLLPVGDGFLVSAYGVGGDHPSNVLRRVGADSAEVTRVDLQRGAMAMYESCGGGLNLPPIFSPEVVWDARAGVVAYSHGPDYAITIVEPDGTVRSVRRDRASVEGTRELAIRELGDGFRINFGRGPCVIPAAEMVEDRGFMPWVQAIRALAILPDGGLWVERWEPGRAPGPIDVFDATGAYTGTLPDSSPFPVLFLPDGRIAVAETDADDVERLAIYRMQW